jgi:PRTRC genetic system protein B
MSIQATCLLSEFEYELSSAILLYAQKTGYGSPSICFASVHEVETEKGVPQIKAGTPIAKSALLEALRQLAPDEYSQSELFGENILAKGNDHLVWYVKPQQRQVWFKNKELGDVSAVTHNPGLVFVVSNNKWFVFAINGNERPNNTTPLYVAPYLNVWKGGHICTGNIDLPKGAARFDTDAWEQCFYRSYFTHPNVHTKGGLTKFRGGIFALWRSLMKGKAFPVQSLVPTGETLSDVFERLVKNGRS